MACTKCGKVGAVRLCAGCATAGYCSTECQRADWKGRHKAKCGCNGCGVKLGVADAKTCACGGRVCGACFRVSRCAPCPASIDDDCPICLLPLTLRTRITFRCGHDVCATCYRGLVRSGTNFKCAVCRRRATSVGAPIETPSSASMEKLEDLQMRLSVLLARADLMRLRSHICLLFTDTWSFLADLASTHGGTDTPVDEEIELLGGVIATFEEDDDARGLLFRALLSEDVRENGRNATYCAHPWIELGMRLFGDERAAWTAFTRRTHMPACHFEEHQ